MSPAGAAGSRMELHQGSSNLCTVSGPSLVGEQACFVPRYSSLRDARRSRSAFPLDVRHMADPPRNPGARPAAFEFVSSHEGTKPFTLCRPRVHGCSRQSVSE